MSTRTAEDGLEGSALAGIGRNSAYQVARGVVLALSLVILTPIVVSSLGITGYGAWALLQTMSAYMVLTDVGIGVTVTTQTARLLASGDVNRINGLLHTYLLVYAFIGFVMLGIIVAFSEPIADLLFRESASTAATSDMLRFAAGVFLAGQVLSVYGSLFAGLQRLDVSATVGISGAITTFVASLGALGLGFGLSGLIAAQGAGTIVMFIAYRIAARRIAPFLTLIPSHFDRHLLRSVGRFNVLVGLKTLLGVTHYQADKIIIAGYLGLGSVAVYDLGLRVVSLVAAPFGAMMLAATPAIARANARDSSAGQALFGYLFQLVAAIAIPSFLYVFLFAPLIIDVWLGGRIGREAAFALSALALVYLIGVLTGPADTFLVASGRPGVPLVLGAIFTSIGVILSIVAARGFGLVGVLVAAVVMRLAGAIVFQAAFAAVAPATRAWHLVARSVGTPLAIATLAIAIPWYLSTLLPTPMAVATSVLGFGILYTAAAVRTGMHTTLLRFAPGRGRSQ